MVEFDYASILVPVFLSIAASFGLFALTRFSRTSEGALTGNVKISHIELTVQGLEKRIDERLDRIESFLREGNNESRDAFARVYERLEKIETDTKIHSYRLDQIDKHSGRSSNRE